jgi:hypothetical protein
VAGKLNIVGAGYGLDAATGRATVSARTVYLALLTAVPAANVTPASMVEYAVAGYSRQICAMSVPSGTPRVTSNTGTITYGPLTGANNTTQIVGWALVSTASGTTGDVVAQGDWSTARTPAANDQLTVSPGGVTVSID